MRPLVKSGLLLFLITVQTGLMAQVINGLWKGNYSRTHIFTDPKSLYVEFFLSNDSIITGASHLYYNNNKYEHHKITGKFFPKDSSILFSESLIETNFKADVVEVTYKMKLRSTGNSWRLEGKWKGAESIFGYLFYHTVWLEKPKDSIPQIIPVPDSVPVINLDPETEKLNRVSDIQKIIEIPASEKDSIMVSVYDNGEIDGDSVSVYLNDSIIIENKMVTGNPISFYLSLDKTKQFQKIKMVAQNLGSIPPNTALMIINTRKKRYEVRLTSSFEKNAVVEFVLLE